MEISAVLRVCVLAVLVFLGLPGIGSTRGGPFRDGSDAPVLAGRNLSGHATGHGPAGATLKLLYAPELGVQVIRFEGEIKAGSFDGLRELITEARSRNPPNQVYLALHSPGGLLDEALKAGELVKSSGVGTVLLPGTACMSACAYLFFSGRDGVSHRPRRLVFAGSRIGVHQAFPRYKPERSDEPLKIRELSPMYAFVQDRIGRMLRYLNDMEVSSEIQERIFSTPPKSIYYLTTTELRAGKTLLVRQASGQWLPDADVADVLLPSGLRRADEPREPPRRDPPLVPSAGAALPGGVFVTDRAWPKSGLNGLIPYSATWAVGERNGAPCFDVDASQGPRHLVISLCRRERLAGTIDPSLGLFPAGSEVGSVALVDFDGRVDTLLVHDAADGGMRARGPVRFAVEEPAGEPGPHGGTSELRFLLTAGGHVTEVALFVPQAAQAFVQQRLLKTRMSE